MDLEADVERLFCWYVERMGGMTWKFKSPGRRGVPDRLACLPGQMWFVELKRPEGRKAEAQKAFAVEMELLYQNYACLWSRDQVVQWAALRVLESTKMKRPISFMNGIAH
jgi:hypothetical protein